MENGSAGHSDIAPKSEHWVQWGWRPFNGFMFGLTLFCCYVLLPLFGKPPVHIPEVVMMSWAGILGVSAWHRGAQKRGDAGNA